MIWITFRWISGWCQVKSGQTRSNFEVGLFKQNWCLSDSVFNDEFNASTFIFVDGLELPKIAVQNFDMYGFRGFGGNLGTKNWRIASKFGMGIENTSLQNIYSGFLRIQNTFWFFIGLPKISFFWQFWDQKLKILKMRESHFVALGDLHTCWLFKQIALKMDFFGEFLNI